MRRSPLPEREKAICDRLRLWRESLGLTRAVVASEIGLTPESYANYEYARAPLRYGLVDKLTSRFDLNPSWLATGDGPKDIRVRLPRAETLGVSPRNLFTEVFNAELVAKVQEQIERFFDQPHSSLRSVTTRVSRMPSGYPINSQTRAHLEFALIEQVQKWVVELPDSELIDFINRLLEFADTLFAYKVFHTSPEAPADLEKRRTGLESARSKLAFEKEMRKHREI